MNMIDVRRMMGMHKVYVQLYDNTELCGVDTSGVHLSTEGILNFATLMEDAECPFEWEITERSYDLTMFPYMVSIKLENTKFYTILNKEEKELVREELVKNEVGEEANDQMDV